LCLATSVDPRGWNTQVGTRPGLKRLPLHQPRSKSAPRPGASFLNALTDNPSLIPRFSYPQSVYFLLSEDNFLYAWNQWLAPGLESKGYDVTVEYFSLSSITLRAEPTLWQEPAKKPSLYFSVVRDYLTRRWRDGTDAFTSIKDEVLQIILEGTMMVEDTRREVRDHCEQYRGVRPHVIGWLLLLP
jgi:hypothetical protein